MTSTPLRDRWSRYVFVFFCSVFLFLCTAKMVLAAPSVAGNTVNTQNLVGSASNTASYTFNHTVSGSYRLLVVGVSMNVTSSTTAQITGITYNGLAMTRQAAITNSTNVRRVEMWTLINPPTGTAVVSVNAQIASGATVGIVTAAVTVVGVDQSSPLGTSGTAQGNGSPATVTIASGADDLVLDTEASTSGSNITQGANQTQVWEQNTTGGTNDIRGAGSTEPGNGGNVTMSETINGGGRWAIAALDIKPVANRACATPGKDGAGGTLTGVVNTYYSPTASAAAGATSIPLNAGVGFNSAITAGDLLIVMQMQDASINSSNDERYGDGTGTAAGTTGDGSGYAALNSAGKYEYVIATNNAVTFLGGGTLTFAGAGTGGGLLNSYAQAAATGTKGQSRYQVIRVPQYSTATLSSTLTVTAWNGTVGGVLAIDVAGVLTLGGTVSLDGMGFRGGGGRILGGGTGANTDYRTNATNAANGGKGEGIAGLPRYLLVGGAIQNNGAEGMPNGSMARGAPGNAGGGGTDGHPTGNDQNTGGGGGGNGGAGGKGGNAWNSASPSGGWGGAALPATQSLLFLGGGGGSGTSNNGTSDPNTNTTGINSSGTAGGGMVIILAGSTTGTGTISANGIDALNVLNDGAGGGGAGGTIVVVTKFGNLSGLTVSAKGGNGGSAWLSQPANCGGTCEYHGPGGGGGGGVVLLSSAPASSNVSGGTNGLTTLDNIAFGSTAGTAGLSSTSATLAAFPGTSSGAECAPDLTISKIGNGPFTRGGSFTYTLSVGNIGLLDTAGVVTVTDTLPAGMVPTLASGTGWSCSVAAQTIGCNRTDALAATANYPNISVAGSVGQTALDVVVNSATTEGGGEFYLLNDTGTDTSSASSIADLSVISSDAPDPVPAGSNLTYTQVVTNSGPSDAINSTFVTTIPANTGFQSLAVPSGWNCITPAIGASGTITCTRINQPAGTSSTFSVVTQVNNGVASGTILLNAAYAASLSLDPSSANNTALSATTVGTAAGADVTLSNIASPLALAVNSNVTYTQVIRNQGSAAATAVTFSNPTPANTTFVSFVSPGGGWSCTPPSVGSAGTLTCNIASLAAGATATVSMTVKLTSGSAGSNVTDTATVNATNDSIPGNNSASAGAVIAAATDSDLAVTNVASASQVLAGNPVGFTQTITNNGPAAATNITVNESVPANTTFQSMTVPPGWSCTAPAPTNFTCSVASLAVGASATLQMQVNVASGTPNNTVITDSVTATPSNGDSNIANSTNIQASTTVTVGDNLVITNTLNTGSPDPVTAGGTYTLAQTLTNAGPSDSGTITLTETIPANVTVGTITKPGTWSCGAQVGNTITCTGPSLAPGAPALNFLIPLTVNAGTPAGTILTETASVLSTTPEKIPENNTASYTNSVAGAGQYDLAVSAATTPEPVVAGQNLTVSGTINNKGPSAVTNPSFSLPLPTGTTFVSLSVPAGATCNTPSVGQAPPYTITCSFTGSYPAGLGPQAFSLGLKVNASQTSAIASTGSLSPTANDSNPANNSFSVTADVITEADLSITNVATPDPLNTTTSNTITYTQAITNNGPSDATSVIVTETIPAGTGTVNVTTKPASWNCTALVGTQFTCSGPSLAALATANIVFTVVNTNPSGKLTETASVTSSVSELNSSNNTASATTTLATSTQSDMKVAVNASSGTVSAGTNVTFTSVVTNRGPGTAANVTVTIPVPPNSTFQSFTPPVGWTCSSLSVGTTGSITCTIASLASGATPNFVMVVQSNASATPGTVIGETVSVALGTPANDPDHTNDSATASSVVTNATSADVSISITPSATTVKQGSPVTLTIGVANAGPASATGVTVSAPLAAEEQFVSATPTQGTCQFAGGVVTCSLGTIANGGTASIALIVNAAAIGLPTNTATVSANETDPIPSNNSASTSMLFTSPTAIKLDSFNATANGDKIVLEWRTSEEIRNLGFNVYREVGGEYTKLNRSLIAGAAVRMRVAIAQHTPSAYSWTDSESVQGARYWLEDVTLSGVHTWNGPATANQVNARALHTTARAAATFAELNQAKLTVWNSTSIMPVQAPVNGAAISLYRPSRSQAPTELSSSYLAGREAVKIGVQQEGWYRISQSDLANAGMDTNISPEALHLYARGKVVPTLINHGQSEWTIEFYGQAADTPYTGTRIYWLTPLAGWSQRVITNINDGDEPPTAGYLATAERRDRTFYFAALTNNGDNDNFFGDVLAGEPLDQHITVNGIASQAASTARLDITLQGMVDGAPHHVAVTLNGTSLGDILFTGMDQGTFSLDTSLGVFNEGDNVVTLTPLAGDDDVSAVARIAITYVRQFSALNDTLRFTIPAQSSAKVTGFTSPMQVYQLESASVATPSTIKEGDNTYSAVLQNSDTIDHTYYAFTAPQVQSAASVTLNTPSSYSGSNNAGDLLIVSHKDFISALAPLISLRQSQGVTAKVVDIEDVYDEFNFGEPSADALRSLVTASAAWNKPPKFLLLVGDASVDPRNYLGLGSFDFVPTKLVATAEMKTASDGWFSETDGDGQPKLATGRLPVRTQQEAATVIAKIVGYEQQAAGSWVQNALLVNDHNTGANFSGESANVGSLLPGSLSPTYFNLETVDPNTAHSNLIAQFNTGQLLVNYLGHGSVDVWSGSSLLNGSDALALTNGTQTPVVLSMECLNGFFHDVFQTSLAESLLLAPQGGAVGVWASSGLTDPEPQFVMDKLAVQYLFATPAMTIGEATTQAKSGAENIDVRRTWNLFGDPSMKLRTSGTPPQ